MKEEYMQNNKKLLSFKCSHCGKSNEFCEVNSNCEKEESLDNFSMFFILEQKPNPNIPKKFYIIKYIVDYIFFLLTMGAVILFFIGMYDLSKGESNFYIDFLFKILNIEKIDSYTELFLLYLTNLLPSSFIFLLFLFIELFIDCYVEISAKKKTLREENIDRGCH